MKKLKIYQENGEFVIERVNEFNHATKRLFVTEIGLFEGLQAYKDVMADYELEVSDDLWGKVINFLKTGEIPSHGGKREGAGRPSVGTTRRVSLTLPDDLWDLIDKRKKEWGVSQSQTLRKMIEKYFASSS